MNAKTESRVTAIVAIAATIALALTPAARAETVEIPVLKDATLI